MKNSTFLFVMAISASLFFGSSAFGQIGARGGTPSANNVGTTVTIVRPSGLAVGDVMFANIAQNDQDGADGGDLSDASSPGWTVIDGRQIGATGGGTGDEWYATVLYKVATASDVAAANFVFTLDPDADGGTGALAAFFGVDVTGGVTETGAAGGPFDIDPGIFNHIANDATLNADGITTVTSEAAIVMFGSEGAAHGFSAWTTATHGGLTELYDHTSTTGLDNAVGAAWDIVSPAASTGDGSATIGSPGGPNGAIIIALKPLPPSVTLNPGTTQNLIYVTGTVSQGLTATVADFGGSGNYLYTWSVSPSGPTVSGTNPQSSASTTNTKTITFSAIGSYTVSVKVSRTGASDVTQSVLVNVLTPNLYSTSGSSSVQAWVVDPSSGGVIAGPENVFTPSASTAALGKNDKSHATDPQGYLYWIPNNGANGIVNVYARNPDGSGSSVQVITNWDLNGGGDNTDLGLVRLGVDPLGYGWILAQGGGVVYLAKFQCQGTTVTDATRVVVNSNVTIAGGGSAATFQNGDVAFVANGTMYALANISGDSSFIYTMDVFSQTTTLNKKWTVKTPAGGNFSGSVNGIAFTQSGSMHVSTSDGLYFLDQNTVNSATGSVNCSLIQSMNGLTDLASDKLPQQTTLPVTLTDFTVTQSGSNAVLNWSTASEINTDHFDIERSADAINFNTVGTKPAVGNSSSPTGYQFIDPISSSAKIIYYRLKTVSADGKITYSKIVVLRLNGQIVKNFTVYPNPFNSDLKLQISSEKETEVTIRISNALGQPVVNRKVLLQKGENIVVLSSELQNLKPGMHLLEIISEDGKLTQKIIKR